MTHTTPGITLAFQSERAKLDGQLTQKLTDFITATHTTLDCAIYDLRHPAILSALAQVATTGKQLRIVYDAGKQHSGGLMADPKPSGSQAAIQSAGLTQYAHALHEGSHLMHDKFLIRDNAAVWTGSANFTIGGLTKQDNNCLIFDSPALAAQYAAAFTDLISPNHHHPGHRAQEAAHPTGSPVSIGHATVTPAYAPAAGEAIETMLNAALNHGVRKVRIMAFLISDPGILQTLATLGKDSNVDIRGVYDPNGMKDAMRYSKLDSSLFWFTKDHRFVAAPSHAFSPAREQDFMHNKTIILDDRIVLTGSYNFSENAEANDENLLRIESPDIAAAYTTYFDTLYSAYGGAALATATTARGWFHLPWARR